ncbi:hypothetical protein [Curtobacterium sp. CFBP9011]|uniref:hypothetical protein n=1 Tax=Curtobacterium sp. CFBP9011 TaxID=3096530 RepID=UPI002A6A8EA5|nr:hypothetical protein [Curtobacterium sp. CFBP9011]MDY1005760.1 hypothetical protein [Curtobacterium sp. CFBP9011]
MQTPIARFARWLAHRNDRPADATSCFECHREVDPAEGEWIADRKALLCDDEKCSTAFQTAWAV